MAKAINYLEKHLSIIVMCVSIFSMMVGFYTSAQAQNNMQTNKELGLESRLTAIETQLKLIMTHFNIEDKTNK